jgi:hypothetical protein
VGTAMETSGNNSVVIQMHNSSQAHGAYDRNENVNPWLFSLRAFASLRLCVGFLSFSLFARS